jgi:hydroxymethylbilane synthase
MAALKLGTRGSKLALTQAGLVRDALARSVPALAAPDAIEIVVIKTTGDAIQDRPLSEAGGKGLFVKEIEEAMLARRIDIAVHSMKDMPTAQPAGLLIAAFLAREDARDVLIAGDVKRIADLAQGAVIGTSALRRRAQLLHRRPDLKIVTLRGNVDTRLRKLAAGEVDVLVLAAAGLDRLDRRREAGGSLFGDVFVPAPGQGVIAVQAREGSAAADVAASVSHGRTLACLRAERAAVRELAASCHTPVGIHADRVRVRGFAGLPDGSEWIVDEISLAVDHEPVARGDKAAVAGGYEAVTRGVDSGAVRGEGYEAAAITLARRMLAAGAGDLLRAAEAMAAR